MKAGLINTCTQNIQEKVFTEISEKRFARQSVISAIFEGKFLPSMWFEATCNASLYFKDFSSRSATYKEIFKDLE